MAGLTFESGLRALLRQDPDIIMVGETRDAETAAISVRAGHHRAHGVFHAAHKRRARLGPRALADMGVEPYMAANALAGLVAQRLLRKVCPHCGQEEPLTPEEAALLGPQVPRGAPRPRLPALATGPATAAAWPSMSLSRWTKRCAA